MDIHNELKAMMDINLKPEFELAINEVIEKSYKADIEKLGPGMAGLVKCQWEKMKPYLFFAYCLGAKAQAVPEGFVSVEDKLPIDGQDVIAFDAIKHCVFKGGEFLQGYIESDTGHEYEEPVEVTHWMAVEAQEQG